MSYTNVTEVKERLSADGSDATGSTAAAMSNTALQGAVDDAIAEIDARVGGTPFDPTPPLVATIATDVAAYLATLTHRKGNPLPSEHPVVLRYARAQALLQKAELGQLDLVEPEGTEGSEPTVVNPYEGDLFTLSDVGLGPDPKAPWLG